MIKKRYYLSSFLQFPETILQCILLRDIFQKIHSHHHQARSTHHKIQQSKACAGSMLRSLTPVVVVVQSTQFPLQNIGNSSTYILCNEFLSSILRHLGTVPGGVVALSRVFVRSRFLRPKSSAVFSFVVCIGHQYPRNRSRGNRSAARKSVYEAKGDSSWDCSSFSRLQ